MRSEQTRRRNVFFFATRRWRPCNNRRGATVVEMAVVAPVFFGLLFGLIEFGRVTMVNQSLSDAARAACRTACLATTTNANKCELAARSHLQTFLSVAGDTDKCRITVQPADFSEIERGNEITINVEVNFSDVSWISTGYLGDPILGGGATMTRD
jgi:hypothetical protein